MMSNSSTKFRIPPPVRSRKWSCATSTRATSFPGKSCVEKSKTEIEDAVTAIMEPLKNLQGSLIPVLHAVQAELGCIPPAAVPVIGSHLNLSRAEVHGVIHFYHDFREEPAGDHLVKICRAEACQAMGAAALERYVQKRLGISFGETTVDGRFSLEPVYCLGNCACSPSIQIGDRQYARVDNRKFDALIEPLEEKG